MVEWISCRDRLPERGERVIVSTDEGFTFAVFCQEDGGEWITRENDGKKRTQEWAGSRSTWWETENQDMQSVNYWAPIKALGEPSSGDKA
jgi:hypothetical protein